MIHMHITRLFSRLLAWVGLLAVAASGFFGPLPGRLTAADQFSARVVVVCGSLLCATGLLLTSVEPNLYLLFLTYGEIFGISWSFVYIALFEIVPRYFIKHRSLATGPLKMGTVAGIVFISPICMSSSAYSIWMEGSFYRSWVYRLHC